jgi:hypothetical protein
LDDVWNLDAGCVLNDIVVGLCLRDGGIGPIDLAFRHALSVALPVEFGNIRFASLGKCGSTLNLTARQAFFGVSQSEPGQKASGGDDSGELHIGKQ